MTDDVATVLAMCVSALVAAGHGDHGYVQEALRLLDGRGGRDDQGRTWTCVQGRVTWQTTSE